MKIIIKEDGKFQINCGKITQKGSCSKEDEFIIDAEVAIEGEAKIFTINSDCIVDRFSSGGGREYITVICPFCKTQMHFDLWSEGKKMKCTELLGHSHEIIFDTK